MSQTELIDSLNDYADIVDWINHTLDQQEGSKDLSALDQRITHLVATLEIACEDTSTQLERTIDDVSRGVPRLTYDLHFMKDGALSLQATLAKVHSSSKGSVPQATAEALDQLHTLDNIKKHMESAREVLKEAESWSSLEFEVTSLLAEQSYTKAAERLSEANRSMVVFQNTPEYESRRTLMVSLQNQLEASLSSALVAAINSQDVVVCRNYFSIFCAIQREAEFRNYYNGSRRGPLVSSWHDANLVDADSAPTSSAFRPQTFSEFLPKFYTAFLTLLESERTSIPTIFPDPQVSLSTLITSTFSALQPTFTQRLSSLFTHYGAPALKDVIAIYKATDDFANNTNKVMEKIKFADVITSTGDNPPTETTPSVTTAKSARRRSNRMSMSLRPGSNRAGSSTAINLKAAMEGLDWDHELFQPFLDLQVDYGSLEKRMLDHALGKIVTAQRILQSDQARLLRERSVDIFSVAEDSIARCTAFTHGYGAVGLLHALDHFFRSFVDLWTAAIASSQNNSTKAEVKLVTGTVDLEDLDYTDDDWAQFQVALHLLASARAVYERLGMFEIKLRASLSQMSMTIKLSRHDSVFSSTRSEGQLLSQSVLNSAELHNLLDSLDPEHQQQQQPASQSQTLAPPTPRFNTTAHPIQLGSSSPLLVEARAGIFEFSKACQTSLQNTILSPLRSHLSTYASSPLWTTPGDPKTTRVSANDLSVPSFSLSPSEIIQRVAEGLLNLPRLFEVYGDDDALAFSLQTLPYLDPEAIKGLGETSQEAAGGVIPPSLTRRPSSSNFSAPRPAAAAALHLSPEAVSSAWLSSLGHSILSHLTVTVLPAIGKLTLAGAAQLSSDLGYLSNIVRALNVEYDELERWKEYVGYSEEEGRKKGKEGVKDEIFRKVARMRGWAVG